MDSKYDAVTGTSQKSKFRGGKWVVSAGFQNYTTKLQTSMGVLCVMRCYHPSLVTEQTCIQTIHSSLTMNYLTAMGAQSPSQLF